MDGTSMTIHRRGEAGAESPAEPAHSKPIEDLRF
jgi:hypothetical protein